MFLAQLFPPPRARFIMAGACLLGLFASGYLLYTYLTGAPITCAVISGCDAVRASKWAWTLGIPRPALGLFFYQLVFLLLVVRVAVGDYARPFFRATQVLALIGFIESGILFFIQWLDVKAFCLWCLISALASTIIFVMAFFDRPITEEERQTPRELRWYFYLLLGFFPVAVGTFWRLKA